MDYRGLNKITRKDRYPLPLISDLLDTPQKARIYTKIDLCHAYNLVRIAPGNKWKTAFRTRYGSFERLVMPFRLSNTPAAFQCFINEVFADLLDVCIVVYLDDILIYSNSLEEHQQHVKEVIQRLRKFKLYARADKPDHGGVEGEGNSQLTGTPKRPGHFLGFVNFYRRFIHNYSKIVLPLTRLTRKGVPWNFDQRCQDSFNALKKAFTFTPILCHWEPDRQITIKMDASDYAIAGILSITTESGELHPIVFHSRTLSGAELNYNTHNKELLAIFECFKTWHHYLEGSGTPIDIVTDHKNLEYFSTTKLLTPQQHGSYSAVRSLKHDRPDLRLTLRWVPGHADVPGNEAADEAAKAAAAGDSSSVQQLPRSLRKPLPQSSSRLRQSFKADLEQ
ncbi:hypothetical protein BN946_scf184805.g20 [Trametes cinnabarina]|uniref:Reverse transcriptase domain-containing protein n=1 Tax=Pycnoporus cinnabarinus TaxID=5643 RepID=A0A060S3U6_PYCCI|nr:hypothetical protein BN946_scf184805.g20 [Trametes cinnabarina]